MASTFLHGYSDHLVAASLMSEQTPGLPRGVLGPFKLKAARCAATYNGAINLSMDRDAMGG